MLGLRYHTSLPSVARFSPPPVIFSIIVALLSIFPFSTSAIGVKGDVFADLNEDLAAEQKADFIVSLAGMVISGAETLLSQNRIALAQAGMSQETIDTYCRILGEAFEAEINGGSAPDPGKYDLPDDLKQNYLAVLSQIRTPYLHYFISLDMRKLLDKIGCPVLALNGTKDLQVEAESNLSALAAGMTANNIRKIEKVEGVNHLFQHCTTGAVTEYGEIEETIAPEVLETITKWIQTTIQHRK